MQTAGRNLPGTVNQKVETPKKHINKNKVSKETIKPRKIKLEIKGNQVRLEVITDAGVALEQIAEDYIRAFKLIGISDTTDSPEASTVTIPHAADLIVLKEENRVHILEISIKKNMNESCLVITGRLES